MTLIEALDESLRAGVNAAGMKYAQLVGGQLYAYDLIAESLPSGEMRMAFKFRFGSAASDVETSVNFGAEHFEFTPANSSPQSASTPSAS